MSTAPSPPGPAAPPQGAADPSMEDILASIRRILSEDEQGTQAPPGPPVAAESVLVLDPSMMVPEEAEEPTIAVPPPAPAPPPPPPAARRPDPPPVPEPPRIETPIPATATLVAPEAAAAAASAVGALVRTLAVERTTATHRGGPTIEDMVREELRPLLKAWLDQNLPPLVERLVQAEIERLVNRALP